MSDFFKIGLRKRYRGFLQTAATNAMLCSEEYADKLLSRVTSPATADQRALVRQSVVMVFVFAYNTIFAHQWLDNQLFSFAGMDFVHEQWKAFKYRFPKADKAFFYEQSKSTSDSILESGAKANFALPLYIDPPPEELDATVCGHFVLIVSWLLRLATDQNAVSYFNMVFTECFRRATEQQTFLAPMKVFLLKENALPKEDSTSGSLPGQQGRKAHFEKAVEMRDENISKPSGLIETLESEWKDPALSEFAQKAKILIESNLGIFDLFLVEAAKSFVIRQSFVKHQVFAYLAIFSIEFKKRHPALLIGYQNQLIREIRASLPLLSYQNEQLIDGFHAFQANLFELSQQKEIKFYFDLTREDQKSAPSVPGYLSHLVCEEAHINEDPKSFELLFRLFNNLIESAQKEHPFDQILDSFIQRISVVN